MAPTPAFFLQLPLDLRSIIVEYLCQDDQGTLLQLGREVGQLFAPTITKLEVPEAQLPESVYKSEALLRLLKKLPNLRELDLDLQDPNQHEEVGLLLLAALEDGSVGTQLRSLCLGCYSTEAVRGLFALLRAGLLPLLAELELIALGDYDSGDDEEGYSVEHLSSISAADLKPLGLAFAEALEARRELGLPPLTRLEGIGNFKVSVLRRVWACCPVDRVEFMDAEGGPRLAALDQRLHGQSVFSALKALELGGSESGEEDDDDDEEEEDGQEEEEDDDAPLKLAEVIETLAQGQTPLLEEVSIGSWDPDMGDMTPLAQAIGQGRFPALASLDMEEVELDEGGFQAFVEGLQAYGGVQQLFLAWVNVLDEEEVAAFANALKDTEKKGFAQLKEIGLIGSYVSWDPVVEALAKGAAPCAAILTSLTLSEGAVTGAGFQAFLEALGDGAFPALSRLEVDADEDVDDQAVMQGVPQALLALAQKSQATATAAAPPPPPCLLKELSLSADTGWAGCIHELGRVFKLDGLPHLTDVDIRMAAEGAKRGSAGLFEGWKRAGAKIKVEWMSLDVNMSKELQRRFLKSLADPAFCPSLRHVRCGVYVEEEIDQALERRRERRDRAAAMRT